MARMFGSCGCGGVSRRLFTGALLGAGMGAGMGTAAAAIPECRRSKAASIVPAEQVESSARQQYRQMLLQANEKKALLPADNAQLQRLRYMAQRIIPFTPECNERARNWQWEVNLLASRSINAFCMPGGKIAFYYGILSELQLDDDEVAVIMGHEVAHALLEHAREQAGKNTITTGGLRVLSSLLGLGQLGDLAAQGGGYLASLKFSRSDETEADRLGLIMSARAGYDPKKGVSLWQKMAAASGNASNTGGSGGKGSGMSNWFSTHPAQADRIQDIEGRQSQVAPIFAAAAKPDRRFGPPARLPPEERPKR